MIPALPKRRNNKLEQNRLEKFSDFIGKSAAEIKKNVSHGIYIDDPELFKKNFDLFERIIKMGDFSDVYSKDLSCLQFIEDNLKEPTSLRFGIVDDGENKDRSYIDISYFEKMNISVPLVYTMWNVQMNSDLNTSCYFNKSTFFPMIADGFKTISLDGLKKIEDIVSSLHDQWGTCTDEEKIILVSNYLQNQVQYVAEQNISEGSKGIYITDSKGIIVNQNVHSAETVLLQGFGVCEGIGNATTLLLNNPTFNMNVRSVRGPGHVWNVCEIGGKYYYLDNTWSITRNEEQYPDSLKASSFTSKYLLFGSETASVMGHHEANSVIPAIERFDYPQESIVQTQKCLVKKANFSGYNKPVFESKLKKY